MLTESIKNIICCDLAQKGNANFSSLLLLLSVNAFPKQKALDCQGAMGEKGRKANTSVHNHVNKQATSDRQQANAACVC